MAERPGARHLDACVHFGSVPIIEYMMRPAWPIRSMRFLFLSLMVALPLQARGFSVGTQNLYFHNSRLDERKANLQNELQSEGAPDIFGFQESAKWRLRQHLYDLFMKLSGFEGIYKNTGEFGVMNNGIALVSRLESRQLAAIKLPREKLMANQFLTSGIFKTQDGREVLVLNTHLSPQLKGKISRVEQARFILSYLKKFSAIPAIVVGDLNDSYGSETLKIFLKNGFADVLGGEGATYDPATNPLITDSQFGPSRLDYILYQPGRLVPVNPRLIFKGNWVSDHYGIKTDFVFSQNP